MTEPRIAQKGPFAVEVKAGERYTWCACGRSESQPFCDGSHKGTGITPKTFKAEKSETVYLCGCKRSHAKPFCDGTHATL